MFTSNIEFPQGFFFFIVPLSSLPQTQLRSSCIQIVSSGLVVSMSTWICRGINLDGLSEHCATYSPNRLNPATINPSNIANSRPSLGQERSTARPDRCAESLADPERPAFSSGLRLPLVIINGTPDRSRALSSMAINSWLRPMIKGSHFSSKYFHAITFSFFL